MIIQLSEEVCATPHCQTKLKNGNNIGGFKAHRTQQGNYQIGYTCKRCSAGSTTGTKRLALFEQTHHYNSYHNVTNSEIEHKRQWRTLTTSLLQEDDEKENNATKMPTWKQIQPKQKGAKKK